MDGALSKRKLYYAYQKHTECANSEDELHTLSQKHNKMSQQNYAINKTYLICSPWCFVTI